MNPAALTLKKYSQVISSDLLQALKQSALDKDISLDLEIAVRLMASFTRPEACGISPRLNAILNYDFKQTDAFIQNKHHREQWLYLYEMEKLRLFVRFENKLPRTLKEKFTLIDAKALIDKIRNELQENPEQE